MPSIGKVASERDAEVRRKVDALAAVKPALSAYARAHGGYFILYGSAARGEMRFHSDVDLLVDFAKDRTAMPGILLSPCASRTG